MRYINENVYLVEGKVNAVFYDFNQWRLVHISKDAKELLRRVLDSGSNLTTIECEYLDKLTSLGVLTKKYTEPHEIFDLIEKPVINFAWIEVTNLCNLKCIHCYNESEPICGSVMSYDDFCHVINEIKAYGIRKIQIIGGEPLTLGCMLTQYLDYIIGKFDYVEIFTNGTLLDNNLTDYIKKNGIRVALSVYSYKAEEHDKVTLYPGSWSKTNEAIRRLKEKGIKYTVKNVLIKEINIGEKNTDMYTLSQLKDVVRLTGRGSKSLLSRDLAQKRLITKNSFCHRLSRGFVKRCISGHNCFSNKLYFSCDLTVYPCVMERRFSHGNIKGRHLAEILNPDIFSMNKDKIHECSECEFRYCCFDCRPDSNGQLHDSKPWYCTYSPLIGKWEDENKFLDRLALEN